MKSITILIPAYNEAESFEDIKRCMNQVINDNPNYTWQFLLINDGSTDQTLQLMIEAHHSDNRYHYIDLSRNYGKEIAIMAGLDHIDTDAVIMMDADMQHPIEIIPKMIKYWEEGYDDVYAQREKSDESWLNWIGYKKKGILYHQNERKHGKTKWSYYKLLNLALTGITSFTTVPLRFASIFGFFVSLLAFAYLTYIIIKTLIYGDPVQGYPTLMVTILFLGGIQLIALGIIGEYLSHIFNETKKRPGYFIREYK